MSSSFLKTSPYSSSYGLYGAGTINPYASYFGSPPPTATATSSTTPSQNPPQPSGPSIASPYSFSSPVFGVGSLASGPSGGFNASSATSPLPGSNYASSSITASRPISGGSPPYFSPQPAETRIIGGVTNASGFGGASSTPRPGLGANLVTSPATSGMWGFGSPTGIQDHSQHHEPMHYSPVHSGSSPPTSYSPSGYGHPHPPNPVYLPCYFLGLDQPHHYQGGGSPPSPGSGGNPAGNPGRIGMSTSGFLSPSSAPGRNPVKRTVLFEPKSYPETDPRSGEVRGEPVKKKGPPIHGFGISENRSTKDFLEAVTRTETSPQQTSNSNMFGSQNSPTNTFTPRGNTSAKCWVTIFGFPAGASSFIVTNFSTLGKIMEVKCTPGSNWLHIRFSDPIESRRALSRNGKVLGQSIMVGVIPSDSKVIEEADKTNMSSFGNPTSPAPSPILKERNVGPSASSAGDLKSRIRPLASGYNPHQMMSPPRSQKTNCSTARDTFAVGRDNRDRVPVPTPATGIVTKTLEFFFGW